MKTKIFIASLFISFFFIACNKNANKIKDATSNYELSELKGTVSEQTNDKENQEIPVSKFSPPDTNSIASPTQPTVSARTDWDNKIIKTATLKLEIKDFKKYNGYVHNAVKQYGAYVAQEEQTLSAEKSETAITIKVPVAQFETMMNALPADDGKVMEKKINTEDVTGEVVDTRSRLEAKKQMRLKYLEFLKQSKNMVEVLQVQNEIDNIQMQIESAASRVSFLTQQTAFSTINLIFYQPMAGYNPTDITPSFLTRLGNAFKTGANWIAELFVGLVSVWPLLLIIFIIYFGWRRLKTQKVIAQKF